MIVVMGKAVISAEKKDLYLEEIRESGIIQSVLEEKGCVSYDIAVSATQENVLYMNERWADFYAMQGHLRGKNMRAIAKINGKYGVHYEANVYDGLPPIRHGNE